MASRLGRVPKARRVGRRGKRSLGTGCLKAAPWLWGIYQTDEQAAKIALRGLLLFET